MCDFSSDGIRVYPVRNLPQELCDHIIDHLWDDIAALKACSLVCHSRIPTTRIHLFHTLRVAPPRFTDTDVQPADTWRRNDAEGAPAEEPEVLHSPFGLVAPNVRALVLERQEHALPAWAHALPNVERLALRHGGWCPLRHGGWCPLPHDHRAALARAFPRLAALQLRSVLFLEGAHLLRLLRAFPRLTALSLHDAGCRLPAFQAHTAGQTARPAGGQAQKSVRIRELSLRTTWLPQIVAALMDAPFELQLGSLALEIIDASHGRAAMDLLHAGRKPLADLSLTWFDLRVLARERDRFMLFAHNSRLRALRISRIKLHALRPHVVHPFHVLLSHFNPASLERLTLGLGFDAIQELETFPWKQLDAQLVHWAKRRPASAPLVAAFEIEQRSAWARPGDVDRAMVVIRRVLYGLQGARRAGVRVELVPMHADAEA